MLILRRKFQELNDYDKIIKWLDEWYYDVTENAEYRENYMSGEKKYWSEDKLKFYFLEQVWVRCTSYDPVCVNLSNRPELIKKYYKQKWPSSEYDWKVMLRLYIEFIKNGDLYILCDLKN